MADVRCLLAGCAVGPKEGVEQRVEQQPSLSCCQQLSYAIATLCYLLLTAFVAMVPLMEDSVRRPRQPIIRLLLIGASSTTGAGT
jgi:hypothetical protein